MVGPPWIAVLGSGPRVDADNRSHTNPLTGKPDAGDPPVRLGGRGSGKPLSLPLSGSRGEIAPCPACPPRGVRLPIGPAWPQSSARLMHRPAAQAVGSKLARTKFDLGRR